MNSEIVDKITKALRNHLEIDTSDEDYYFYGTSTDEKLQINNITEISDGYIVDAEILYTTTTHDAYGQDLGAYYDGTERVELKPLKVNKKDFKVVEINSDNNIQNIEKYNTTQNNPHHNKDLLGHTDACLDYYETYYEPNETISLALLYHDIGKSATKGINKKTGFDTFYGHAEKSAEIFLEEIAPYLDKSPEEINYIAELIKNHGFQINRNVAEEKLIALVENHKEGYISDLTLMMTADVMGQSEYQREEKLQDIVNFVNKLKDLPIEIKDIEAAEQHILLAIENEKDNIVFKKNLNSPKESFGQLQEKTEKEYEAQSKGETGRKTAQPMERS